MIEELSNTEYQCPGETYSISRAVHLARLTGYYAACRDCPRRDDTAGLSARQVRRVTEAHSRLRDSTSWPGPESVRNLAINDMTPPAARAVAVDFSRRLLDERKSALPAIVFASDGRLSTAAIVAAVAEGIRWTGCAAVDLGPSSAPCTARGIEQLKADGGIYLGNPSGAAHTLGMRFWIGARRTSFSPTLDEGRLKPILLDRPARTFGPLRRCDATDGYLNDMRPAYHALRPLKFVLRCSCEPIFAYLADLLQNVACRVIPSEPGGDLGGQVAAAKAHFGIEITDDGEGASIFDERGRAVAEEQIAQLLADVAGQAPAADALWTLTFLLVLLSRDDTAFSAMLDKAAVRL